MIRACLYRPRAAQIILLGSCVALVVTLAMAQGPGSSRPSPDRRVIAESPGTRHDRKEQKRDAKRSRRHAMTLGIQIQVQADQALKVSSLDEHSIAARAGLQQNDLILSVDGHKFSSGRQIDAYLASQGGRRVPIVYQRDDQPRTVYVTPDSLAADSAWLGVFLEEGNTNAAGARITHVYPTGPASRAGLQPGDTIVQIDAQKIESPSDLIRFVQESEPQTEAHFHLLRNDEELDVPVTLGSREQFLPPAGGEGGAGPHDGQRGEPSDFGDVPPHLMSLEQDRHNAEQHQRIEQEIQALREEIRQLREELKKK